MTVPTTRVSPLSRGPHGPRVAMSVPILLVLIACGMAATTNAQIFALLLAPMASDFGVSVSHLGALRTIEEITAIATGLALTPFIDRSARKRLLLIGLTLMCVAAICASLAPSPSMLVTYFVLDGVSKILLFSTLLALPGDLSSGHELDRSLGFVIGSFALSGLVLVPVVGALVDRLSWQVGYVVAAFVSVLTLLLVVLHIPVIEPSGAHHGSPIDHFKRIARLPGLILALTGAFLRFLMFATVFTYTGAFLIDHHGVSVGRAGLYLSLGSLAFLCASILSGYVLRHTGIRFVLLGGGTLASVFVVLAFSLDLRLLIAGLALIAVAGLLGFLENASTGLLLRLAPGHRGASMSLNELGAAAGTLFGVGLGAMLLRVAGYTGMGLLLACVGVLAVLVTLLALTRASHALDHAQLHSVSA